MSKKKTTKDHNPFRPNGWGMFQAICTNSMNKGQFPFVIMGTIAVFSLWRMPRKDVTTLLYKFLYSLEHLYVTGWVLCFICFMGWFLHVKFIRRMNGQEMSRIAKEKSKLQEQLTGKKLTSSNVKN